MRKRGQLPGKATLEGDDAVSAASRIHARRRMRIPRHGATDRLVSGVARAGERQEHELRWDQVVTRVRDSNFQMGLRITHLEGCISLQVRLATPEGWVSRQEVTSYGIHPGCEAS